MVSDVEICNMGLQNIGAGQISDLNERSPRAIQCKLRYENLRKAALESYLWNFAEKRADLAPTTATPNWGYSKEFSLPADFLRMVITQDELDRGGCYSVSPVGFITLNCSFPLGDGYAIEASADGLPVLRCNESEKRILYIFYNKNTETYPALFVELLACMIGDALAPVVEANSTLIDRNRARLKDIQTLAQRVDAQQGTVQKRGGSTILDARDAGGGYYPYARY